MTFRARVDIQTDDDNDDDADGDYVMVCNKDFSFIHLFMAFLSLLTMQVVTYYVAMTNDNSYTLLM